jgi:quercetin dioxygenase-like cupin family protein
MKAWFVAAIFMSLPSLFGQDPVQVAPENYRVVFENERVRVLSFHANPREKWKLHAHPDSVVVSLGQYKVRNIVPGSEPTTREARRGDVAWIPARSHTGENIGGTEMDCILVELKEPKK